MKCSFDNHMNAAIFNVENDVDHSSNDNYEQLCSRQDDRVRSTWVFSMKTPSLKFENVNFIQFLILFDLLKAFSGQYS